MNKEEYKDFYNEQSFKNKLQKFAKTAGIQVVYSALLLYYMMKDPSGSRRMLMALTMRIGASIVLFLFLMFSYWMGWIQPDGAL